MKHSLQNIYAFLLSLALVCAANGQRLQFAEIPSELEIAKSKVLPVPYVSTSPPSERQLRELARLLENYRKSSEPEEFSAIGKFLKQRPKSPFDLWLRANIGVVSYEHGCFSQALEALESAWAEHKNGKGSDRRQLRVVNRIGVELAGLYARLGRKEKLADLLTELESRRLFGTDTEKLVAARQGLALMETRPEKSFNCGPHALESIRRHTGLKGPEDKFIEEAEATDSGFSLTSLRDLAQEMKMNYRMAFRDPESEWMTPAVIHWKAGHYAALLSEQGGQYHVKDPTFARDFLVAASSLEREASGYFLIPDKQQLPNGWRWIDDDDGANIYGKGAPTSQEDEDPCPTGCGGGKGMASYGFSMFQAALVLSDTPAFYQTPRGPAMDFTITFLQAGKADTGGAYFSNMGDKWFFNWLSYIQTSSTSSDIAAFLPDGRKENHKYYVDGFRLHRRSQTRISSLPGGGFKRTAQDHSVMEYGRVESGSPSAPKYFLTRIVDVHGNAVSLNYDANDKLISITDCLGQVSTFSYEDPVDSYLITKISTPDGRFATLDYDADGRLETITDMVGITSQLAYEDASLFDHVTKLTTPYGNTTFDCIYNGGDRILEITDPEGLTERVHYSHDQPVARFAPAEQEPDGLNFNDYFQDEGGTLYWDKKAMKHHPGDVAHARYTLWCRSRNGHFISAAVPSVVSAPGVFRMWYLYPDQLSFYSHSTAGNSYQPSQIARVIRDENGQLVNQVYTYSRNGEGMTESVIDPTGRELVYEYQPNGLDPTKVSVNNGGVLETLVTYAYPSNDDHQPISVTDASGQTYGLAYNALGQLEQVTDPLNHKTKNVYDADGYLQRIEQTNDQGQFDIVESFTYDTKGRIRTSTAADGYTVTIDYDDLDRVTKITHPDATFEERFYDNNLLDPTRVVDRESRQTTLTYTGNRQIETVLDPENRLLTYVWCACGDLEELIDAKNQKTIWTRDDLGRVIEKEYADGRKIGYAYEPESGQLSTVTMPNEQGSGNVTYTMSYYVDGKPALLDYTDPATADVNYAYDPVYGRAAQTTDGIGVTTLGYHPLDGVALGAGNLATVDGPWANDTIAYQYDELGRVKRREIRNDDASVQQFIEYEFDARGRVEDIEDDLGLRFHTYAAAGAGDLLEKVEQWRPGESGDPFLIAQMNYTAAAQGQRLEEIHNYLGTGATLSKFNYTHSASGRIQTWARQLGPNAADTTTYTFGYDDVDQLESAVLADPAAAVVKSFAYAYDDAGNRTGKTVDDSIRGYTPNNRNQLTDGALNGPVYVRGALDEVARVTVNGQQALVRKDDAGALQFETTLPGVNGATRPVNIEATDASGNVSQQSLTVAATESEVALEYDANGNTTKRTAFPDTPLKLAVTLYEWDAADRLTAIQSTETPQAGDWRTEFGYDGSSRRVKRTEFTHDGTNWIQDEAVTYLWCGTAICQERDSTGSTVTEHFFGGGFARPDGAGGLDKWYYTRDHLGSVREVVSDAGTLNTRYDYTPYGEVEVVETGGAGVGAPFRYTGHFYHGRSNLHLTLYRVYEPELGRWLSPDPLESTSGKIAELLPEGSNINSYVGNDPINSWDPFGNDTMTVHFVGYPITIPFTDGKQLPLGHSGVVTIDDNGGTQYHEFGRYGNSGCVRRRSVPNLEMKNGSPTKESLDNLKGFLSKEMGKGKLATTTYYGFSDHVKAREWISKVERDSPNWTLAFNCNTFAAGVASAGYPFAVGPFEPPTKSWWWSFGSTKAAAP